MSYGTHHIYERVRRQLERSANGLRFGKLFLRNRWFKTPSAISVSGKRIRLLYPQDRGIHSDFIVCFIHNDYGLSQHLSGIKTILDVGANVGFFSIAARGHYPDAVIHAYEPNPLILRFLDANTSELGIEIHHEAVGGRAGSVRMLYAGDSCNLAQTYTAESGEIPQVSLQTAIDRIGGTVDLLKLDCEGAEWDIFQSDICWQNIKNIRMEYHLVNGKSLEDVKQVLNRFGFAVLKQEPCEGFGTLWAVQTGKPR
jgi:FkbM family methyltransferase